MQAFAACDNSHAVRVLFGVVSEITKVGKCRTDKLIFSTFVYINAAKN
jgi:hypothetical protein